MKFYYFGNPEEVRKMAPKRQRKTNVGVENLDKYKNIVIGDVLCPICRSILIEPVTLPCSHGFCLACFNGTMENTTLTCPLCRIRIGSWLRTAKKENRIINDTLWQILQLKFPTEIQKRKLGEDLETNEKIAIRLANPGEIRREYEIQLAKDQSELQKEREAEEQASKAVIQRILEEEQKVAKLEAEKLRLDEELAKRLANDLKNAGPSNTSVPTVPKKTLGPKTISVDKYFMTMSKKSTEADLKKHSCNNIPKVVLSNNQAIQKLATKSHTSTILCQNRDKKNCSAAYKHLLLTKTLQREQNNSNGSDSGDSIKQEMRYFKPIRTVPKSVPKLLSDGNISVVPLIKVPAILAKKRAPINISKPNNVGLKVISNENSAFVSLFRQKENIVQKGDPQITVNESGKLIKQYYNKKRPQNMKETSTSKLSPTCSPVLGFEEPTNLSDIVRFSVLIKSLSANLNGETEKIVKKVINNNTENVTIINESKNETSQVKNSNCDQEKSDLEFARQLHEQLNNPRYREYVTRSQHKVSKPKGSLRKRQVTLEELVTPKKFKI